MYPTVHLARRDFGSFISVKMNNTVKKIDYRASTNPDVEDISEGSTVQIGESSSKDGEYHRSISARQMHVSQ